MVMVKVPRLALSIWSLAVFAISTSEAAALSPLDEDLFTSKEVGPAAVDNELEQNLGYFEDDYGDNAEPSEDFDKRTNSFAHALRVRRGYGDNSFAHALRVRRGYGDNSFAHALRVRSSPSNFAHALRIKKDSMFNHALRVRNIRASPFTHALRIKKGGNSFLSARSSPFTHALRVRRFDPEEYYFDSEQPKRASSFSHILRV